MLFWIVVSLLALTVAASLIMPLLRLSATKDQPETAPGIYRDQLTEIDRDLARGVLEPDDADAARIEVARRLLDADKRGPTALHEAPRAVSRIAGIVAAVTLMLGAPGLYYWLGAPGYPDVPRAARIVESEAARAARMSQADAEIQAAPLMQPVPLEALPAETQSLITQLRAIVPTRPDDLRGWEILSQQEAAMGNYAAAARAQEHVIEIKGSAATPSDRAALVDRLVSAAAGFVSIETETLLRTILEEDEGNAAARYYMGLLYYQTDRPDVAFRMWRDLAEQGDPAVPHVQLARDGVEEAAFRAGQQYTLPASDTGPSAADVADMAELSPEDQAARIESMVQGLSERLASQGGTVDEWVQLIRALTVLGRNDDAENIWREAVGAFGDDPAAQTLLDAVAAESGITP